MGEKEPGKRTESGGKGAADRFRHKTAADFVLPGTRKKKDSKSKKKRLREEIEKEYDEYKRFENPGYLYKIYTEEPEAIEDAKLLYDKD